MEKPWNLCKKMVEDKWKDEEEWRTIEQKRENLHNKFCTRKNCKFGPPICLRIWFLVPYNLIHGFNPSVFCNTIISVPNLKIGCWLLIACLDHHVSCFYWMLTLIRCKKLTSNKNATHGGQCSIKAWHMIDNIGKLQSTSNFEVRD